VGVFQAQRAAFLEPDYGAAANEGDYALLPLPDCNAGGLMYNVTGCLNLACAGL